MFKSAASPGDPLGVDPAELLRDRLEAALALVEEEDRAALAAGRAVAAVERHHVLPAVVVKVAEDEVRPVGALVQRVQTPSSGLVRVVRPTPWPPIGEAVRGSSFPGTRTISGRSS